MSHLKPVRKWQEKVLPPSCLFLLAAYGYWGQTARQLLQMPVVMISIDGLKQGFKISEETSGPRLRSFKASGSHGFLPDHPEMNSVFFISGPGIPSALLTTIDEQWHFSDIATRSWRSARAARVAHPVARSGTKTGSPISWVGQLTSLQREAAATDALG